MWPFGSAVEATVETALGAKTEFHKDGGFTARDDHGSRTYDREGNKTGEVVHGVLGTSTYDAEGNLTDFKG
ncbi:MAG: hypothetical protein ACREBC_31840 [Pyrinomonadaceae bacterium]